MGKASKWLKNLFARKKGKDGNTAATLTLVSEPVAKEKRRWSFHRLTATAKYLNSRNLVAGTASSRANASEDAAAVKIQTSFRSYLARKALRALKGLVILQALVRGHLVRERAAAALHSMQALISAQARARAQRILTPGEAQSLFSQQQHDDRRSSASHDTEENIKIVKTYLGETFSSTTQEHKDLSSSYRFSSSSCKHETSKSSLQLAPNSSSFISYMASTESSRAKARLWRPDAAESRRSSMEVRRNRPRKLVKAKNISAFLVTEAWSI